jgi:hypothetical protein
MMRGVPALIRPEYPLQASRINAECTLGLLGLSFTGLRTDKFRLKPNN